MSDYDLPCGHSEKYAIFGGDNGCLACSAERVARERYTALVRLAEAELSRDSWKREAELNQQAADESAEYARRLAEAEALRKDAKRYRWLRRGNYSIETARSILNDTPEGIDAAIDAAMEQSQ